MSLNLNGINSNTYISIGLLASIILATWFMSGAIGAARSDVTAAKVEIINRVTKTEERIGQLEKSHETWNDSDMFRWAVHLQKENPNLKIPEPEQHTAR
jgi:hypothetical protein